MKVDNIKLEKIVSSSPLVTVQKKNDFYLLPKELDEKVGTFLHTSHFELECGRTPA